MDAASVSMPTGPPPNLPIMVCNISLSFLKEADVEVITGVNLAMLVQLSDMPKEEENIRNIVKLLKQRGQENIRIASEFLKQRGKR